MLYTPLQTEYADQFGGPKGKKIQIQAIRRYNAGDMFVAIKRTIKNLKPKI